MVARNKQEKAVHVAHLLDHLWHGRTDTALTYLRQDVQAKKPAAIGSLGNVPGEASGGDHRLWPPPAGRQTDWQWPDGKRG